MQECVVFVPISKENKRPKNRVFADGYLLPIRLLLRHRAIVQLETISKTLRPAVDS